MSKLDLRTDEYAQKERELISSYREVKKGLDLSFESKGMSKETHDLFDDSIGNYVNALARPEEINILEDAVENLKEVLLSVDKMKEEEFDTFKEAMHSRLSRLRERKNSFTITPEEYNTARRRMYRVLFAQLGKNKKAIKPSVVKE